MIKATPKRLSLVDEHPQVYNYHIRKDFFSELKLTPKSDCVHMIKEMRRFTIGWGKMDLMDTKVNVK